MMLVRNLDFLPMPREFLKIEEKIYADSSVVMVYIEKKGYSLALKNNDDFESIFLLKTDFGIDDMEKEKKDFVNVLKILINQIYEGTDLKEYERMHPENLFLKFKELIKDDDLVDRISDDSVLYREIEKGFIKLELEVLNNKISSVGNELEDRDWGNKIKKSLNQQN